LSAGHQRLHLHQLGIAFEQHFMQLSADLFSASKEAERDMYRQRDSQFQTIMISATVMMGVCTELFVQGQMPPHTPPWLNIALAVCNGLGFAMFVNTIIISIRVLKMLSKFMYLKAYDQSRGIDHMLKHTDRALRKIYKTITKYNDEEERRLSQSFTPQDRKAIFEGGEGKSELGPDELVPPEGGGVARQALGPHGRVVDEILQDQRRFHELLLRQHDNTAVRRDLNRVTCTFEDYWTQECAWYSRVVYVTFGVGMVALLAASCLYVYGQYVVRFHSQVAAFVFVAMVSLTVLVGAAMLIEVAEKKLQLARYPSLQSNPSKYE
jgi:hypothetical protein